MYEALYLGLHAPVSELHLAQLVGTHDGAPAGILVDLLDPVVWQRTPFGLHRLIELGVFLGQVLVRSDVVLHDVYRVYKKAQKREPRIKGPDSDVTSRKDAVARLLSEHLSRDVSVSGTDWTFFSQWILVFRGSTVAQTPQSSVSHCRASAQTLIPATAHEEMTSWPVDSDTHNFIDRTLGVFNGICRGCAPVRVTTDLPTVLCLFSAEDMLKTSPWFPVSGL